MCLAAALIVMMEGCQTLALCVGHPGIGPRPLNLTSRRFNYVAVRVRVGMRFCNVPIGGRAFGVMMKLSR